MRMAYVPTAPKSTYFGLFGFGTRSAIKQVKSLAQGIWLLRNLSPDVPLTIEVTPISPTTSPPDRFPEQRSSGWQNQVAALASSLDEKTLSDRLSNEFAVESSVFDEDLVGVNTRDDDSRQIDASAFAF
jgi:hypothetical protein